MGNVPTVRISVAGIDAVNCVALRKVVERLTPFQRTIEPVTKPVPFTVSVNPSPPALTLDGERLVMERFPDCVELGTGASKNTQIITLRERTVLFFYDLALLNLF
jgi:hypothetical protein